jgi:hypothetical protein
MMIWHYCFLIKVTEEDIALSFLEEENPLPESDQNFAMASELYFSRAKSASFSSDVMMGPVLISSSYASLPRLDKKSAEGQDDHPLRVLSQECLTVVSTFAGRKRRVYLQSMTEYSRNLHFIFDRHAFHLHPRRWNGQILA